MLPCQLEVAHTKRHPWDEINVDDAEELVWLGRDHLVDDETEPYGIPRLIVVEPYHLLILFLDARLLRKLERKFLRFPDQIDSRTCFRKLLSLPGHIPEFRDRTLPESFGHPLWHCALHEESVIFGSRGLPRSVKAIGKRDERSNDDQLQNNLEKGDHGPIVASSPLFCHNAASIYPSHH